MHIFISVYEVTILILWYDIMSWQYVSQKLIKMKPKIMLDQSIIEDEIYEYVVKIRKKFLKDNCCNWWIQGRKRISHDYI